MNNFRHSGEKGFALITALVLAILYLSLMQLMLMDSTRAMREADRYRSRVVAANGAENAAELAARGLTVQTSANILRNEDYGNLHGTMTRSDAQFVLKGSCDSTGVPPMAASVRVQGRVDLTKTPGRVMVDYTFHSQ